MVDINRGKYFKRINRLAAWATFLTTILLSVLCFSSFVSSTESGKHTRWVADFVKGVLGQNQADTISSISLSKSNADGHKYNYVGDKCILTVKHSPSTAKAGTYTFLSSDESVATVNQDGVVTFLDKGTVKITATLGSDNAIQKTLSLSCSGPMPTEKTAVTLKSTSFKVGQTTDILLDSGKTAASVAKYEVSDPSVLYLSGNAVWAEREGTCDLKAVFEDGTTTHTQINVLPNAKLIVPTAYNTVEDLTFIAGEKMSYKNLIDSIEPEGANKLTFVKSSDESVVKISGQTLIFEGVGQADITLVSAVCPSMSKTFTVTVEKEAPTSLTINMNDYVLVNSKAALKASHDPVAYATDVEWSVVKGNAIITDDGNLMTYFFGDVTIGARSTLNPELYVEKTIKVKLYTSFYMFVRKILGHFSLFAVLGFGFMATSVFLTKPRRLGVALCPGLGFLAAAFCELFQSFVPGRYFAISDICVNFAGTVVGMIAFLAVAALILLIWRIINKESFATFIAAFNKVSIITVFFKSVEIENATVTGEDMTNT